MKSERIKPAHTLLILLAVYSFILPQAMQAQCTATLLYQKNGEQREEYAGIAAGIGDINGDGRGDFIIGSPTLDWGFPDLSYGAGEARVYSGMDGSVMYSYDGDNFSDVYYQFGRRVGRCGDVTGDGVSDFAISARLAPDGLYFRSYYFSGATGGMVYSYNGDFLGSLGDVNGDGKNEIAVLNGTVHVRGRAYMYSGAGIIWTSEPNCMYLTGIGDMNYDGRPDFAVGYQREMSNANFGDCHNGIANWMEGYVEIRSGADFGLITTIFDPDPRGSCSNCTEDCAYGDTYFGSYIEDAGDVNGDGIPDILIGNSSWDYDGASGQCCNGGDYTVNAGKVYIYYGPGTYIIYESGEDDGVPSRWGVAGDVNDDGLTDFTYMDITQIGPEKVGILRVISGFDFNTIWLETFTWYYDEIFASGAGDINADGRDDIIVGNPAARAVGSPYNSGSVYVYSVLPGANLHKSISYPVSNNPRAICAADFDGDGNMDIAAGGNAPDGVRIFKGNGDGTFGTPTICAMGVPTSICAPDVNGDGLLDLVATSYFGGLHVFKNRGNGTFGSTQSEGYMLYLVAGVPVSVFASDFNRDSHTDLAVVINDYGHVLVMMNNYLGYGFDDWGFFMAVPYDPSYPAFYDVGTYPQNGCAADFNGDGAPDMAIPNYSSYNVSVLINDNNGDGTFASSVNYAVMNSPSAVCAADFDGDGDQDLAAAIVGYNIIQILSNNGNGTFADGGFYVTAWGGQEFPDEIVAADLSGDGVVDLAVCNSLTDNVSYLINNCNRFDGPYLGGGKCPAGDNPTSICAADFNGDGLSDLATANYDSHDISVLLNGYAALNIAPPPSYVSGDANGDGEANVGDAVYSISYVFKGGPAPDPLESGDANCDGQLNVGDAVYLIAFVFKGGAAPCYP